MVKVEHMLVASGGEGATGLMCRAKVFRMAMGQRTDEEQGAMSVAVDELPRSVSHPFYEKLNGLLAEHGFDDFVDTQCRRFYAEKMGRPSLAPGQYFRLLLLGYFEGLDSERGIAWRAADSLGVRAFLGGRADRGGAGSFDDIANGAIDRFRHPSDGVHVGASVSGHRWAGQGENAGDRRNDTRSERGFAQHRAPRHRGEL